MAFGTIIPKGLSEYLWTNYTINEIETALADVKLKTAMAEQKAVNALIDHYKPLESWVSGTGQKMKVHAKNSDCDAGCVIHNPTLEPHKDWPTHWRVGEYLMERVCPHGVGHPDLDHLEFVRKIKGEEYAHSQSIHGCDGCCKLRDNDFMTELAQALGM